MQIKSSPNDAEESKYQDKEENWENIGVVEIPMDVKIKMLKNTDTK